MTPARAAGQLDEIAAFKKDIKRVYDEMGQAYYKGAAKTDPCGAKLEEFYHVAHTEYEGLEARKKDALAKFKDISKWCAMRPEWGEEGARIRKTGT